MPKSSPYIKKFSNINLTIFGDTCKFKYNVPWALNHCAREPEFCVYGCGTKEAGTQVSMGLKKSQRTQYM